MRNTTTSYRYMHTHRSIFNIMIYYFYLKFTLLSHTQEMCGKKELIKTIPHPQQTTDSK